MGSHSDMLLVDSGASHNFISKSIVDTLGVRVNYRTPVSVRLASGDSVASDSTVMVPCRFGKVQSLIEF